jgi:hypothetical protein
VLYDTRYEQIPQWLSFFNKETSTVIRNEAGNITTADVYSKQFPAGTIVIGGNVATPASWEDYSNYTLAIKPLKDNFPADSGGVVSLSTIDTDFGNVAINSNSVVKQLIVSNVGDGMLEINQFTASGEFSLDYSCDNNSCTLDITFNPTFEGVQNGAITIESNDANSPHIINLTGNGFAAPTVIRETTASSGKTYTWTKLNIGKAFYTDSAYTYYSFPAELTGLDVLQTANDDKFVADWNAISFAVNIPVTVYVFYDSLYTALPAWMNDFVDTQKIVEMDTGGGNIKSFSIFSKEFAAGSITLGGKAESNYAIVVSPN